MATGNVVSLESDDQPKTNSPRDWHKFWEKEKTAAATRQRKFHKQGNQINQRFLDERASANVGEMEQRTSGAASRLNLFHTNITTMQSMLFGTTPNIDVSREHQDPDDDVARVAAVMYQRILEADTLPSGEDLATVLKAALQDRLIPGLGVARVRYEFETEEQMVMNPETLVPEPTEKITDESAPLDYIHWQDCLWGWCRTWKELPWWGFRVFLTHGEAEARFGKEVADTLEYAEQQPGGDKGQDDNSVESDQKNNVQKAEIWEFWQKADKKVFWYSKGADKILDEKDDPLGLDGFWPMPKPMVANLTTSLFMPRADFIMSQDLYNEIDELNTRVSVITRAIKVVGVYDQSAGDSVGRMLKEGTENDLIPVDNWAMFAEKGGLKGTIDWFPVQDVVGTLQTLITVRDQTIELLYQVTGMSDVLRGANTDQYTSDGTNQLKAKFGSIRVQALQDEFARFASDLEGLKAEVISKHFTKESIVKQSNAPFLPEADRHRVEPALELMQSPNVRWRVNIRPESIAMIDYAQLKSERTEFLTAMATYIQSATSAASAMPGALPVLLEMLKWGMAGFKGADVLEGTMDTAIEAAKKMPQDKPDDGKAEADAAKAKAEMEKIQAKSAADLQLLQTKHQQEMQKGQADHQQKLEQQQAKNQGDMQKIMADLKADMQVIGAKLDADMAVEEAQTTFAAAEREIEHNLDLTEQAAAHDNSMTEIRESARARPESNDE